MKIKDYLTMHRMTPAEFGKLIDREPPTIYAYMSGWTRPSIKTCKRIEKITKGQVTFEESRGEANI